MNREEAKAAVDKIIKKARVHLYKPIQIAEILYRDRTEGEIVLENLSTYRTASRKWRDVICLRFLGRTSTSSARYQDDVFNRNAVPPEALAVLGEENRAKSGIVEAYIYQKFLSRFSQLADALDYTNTHDRSNFQFSEFIDAFWQEPGLRRSIDKVYEIVVYALFSAIVESLNLKIKVSYNPEKSQILEEFKDFADKVIQLDADTSSYETAASIYRVGVTNAADRGLDMWANFGLAIQIKHLSLSEQLASNIVSSVTADRIVIVCKRAEEKVILSLLNQIGWKSRIQAIITEVDLINWYEKAMRGKYSDEIGSKVLKIISNEIELEFPATKRKDFDKFFKGRKYHKLKDKFWR
ncbi:MAG: HaeII family restriction endonuclease [Bacteroidota bacterium]